MKDKNTNKNKNTRRGFAGTMLAGLLASCGGRPNEGDVAGQEIISNFFQEVITGNDAGAIDLFQKHRIPVNSTILCDVHDHLNNKTTEVELPVIALAASRGMSNLVQELIKKGASLGWRDRSTGMSILHYAVQDVQGAGKSVAAPAKGDREKALDKLLEGFDKAGLLKEVTPKPDYIICLAANSANSEALHMLLKDHRYGKIETCPMHTLDALQKKIDLMLNRGRESEGARVIENRKIESDIRKKLLSIGSVDEAERLKKQLQAIRENNAIVGQSQEYGPQFAEIASNIREFLRQQKREAYMQVGRTDGNGRTR